MTRNQLVAIGASLLLALGLYIGCETTPKKYRVLETSRSLSLEQTDIRLLLREAKAQIPPATVNRLEALERQLETAAPDTFKMDILKQLSGQWFTLEQYAIAGYYAQQLAEMNQDAESWSIAGATYAIGLQRIREEQVKAFCASRALSAFENAISLEPDVVPHKINLALVYVELPPQDNPMKGIQMLLELDRENPDNAGVLFHLGRLAIRTGQYDRAIERLNRVLALDSKRIEANCLLSEAYEALGDKPKALEARSRCTL